MANDCAIRLAAPPDALKISLLYHRVYNGAYTDPLVRDVEKLSAFLADSANVWVVGESGGEIVASVAWETDPRHRLAKVFGGAVAPEYRGAGLLERAMRFGVRHFEGEPRRMDVVYATTRTATTAPQIVTERLGYKKLGIFPNVHLTDAYETHCLAALFCAGTLERRFQDFKLHPKIAGLFDLVREETGIPALSIAEEGEYSVARSAGAEPPPLELIDAPLFVERRFARLREDRQIPFHFYPFHQPNALIASPCQEVEIFVYLAPSDRYCTLVGIRKPQDLLFARVLVKASELLRRRGARYLETIARADKLKTVEGILQSGFVPCAYFPAFQLRGELRYDFVVLSKTFEVLDFRDLKLAGTNKRFLREYYRNWREIFLGPHLGEPTA